MIIMSWRFVLIMMLALLATLSFAGACEDACKADYDKWQGIEKAKYDAKSYYCGYTETNCWSRETVPAGQPDPCWGMCDISPFDDSGFQSCCYESAQINNQLSYNQCIANCVPAPPQPVQDNATIAYNVDIASRGDVTMTDADGNAVASLARLPVSIKARQGGSIQLTFKTPSGSQALQVYLAQYSDFRLDGKCPINSSHTAAELSGSPAASLSSEHGTCRGSINGGGDFIKGISGPVASLAGIAHLNAPPPPNPFGLVRVQEDTGPGEPGFELGVSLPNGNIFINSTAGKAYYTAIPVNGGVRVSVSSGSIVVTSDALPGERTTLSTGDYAFLQPYNLTPAFIESSEPECYQASDCPGMEICQDGECASPQCFPAFALATMLISAAFILRRKES